MKKNSDVPSTGSKEFDYYVEIEEPLNESMQIKLDKIKDAVSNGKQLYSSSFDKNISTGGIKEKFAGLAAGEKADGSFRIAGRIMIFRVHGKATFCDLKDSDDKLQLYLNIKNIGEDKYNEFLSFDIGDWIGVEGNVFVTHKGELSLNVTDFRLLSKSIRIMPEKWHGLKDVELRYRQRYLDLIVNPQIKKVFAVRTRVIDAIRDRKSVV